MLAKSSVFGLAVLALVARPGEAAAEEPDCEGAPRLGSMRVPEGCYLDIDGELKRSSVEYDRRLDALTPGHLLTLGELVAFLGAGVLWYAADDERNLADWDFPSWEQRFNLEAWTFDNNHFPINHIGHPLSGAAYYAFPRARDHAVWVSSIYAFMTSFVWEFLVEFREKVSVNDLIVTYGAGANIGEFAHKLWRYAAGIPEKSTVLQDFLNATIGFPVYIKRVVYSEPRTVDGPYDRYGYSNQIGQRLEAGYVMHLHDFGEQVTTHGFRAGGRLSSIPGEGRPGDFSLFFHEADIAELWVTAAFGRDAKQWEIVADSYLLGLYGQRIDTAGHGYSGVAGLEMGYRYRFFQLHDFNDRLGLFHIPGLGADFGYEREDVALRARWRLNADFGGLHAEAYPAWRDSAVGEDVVEKTILRKHKYYFGWGISTRFGGELELGPVDLRASASVGAYDSQEGLDRNQKDVTLDVDATDQILEIDTQIGFTVPTTTLRLGVGWYGTERRSRVGDIHVTRNLSTWSIGVGASL